MEFTKEELKQICIEKYKEATRSAINKSFDENDIWVIENVVNIVYDLLKKKWKNKE